MLKPLLSLLLLTAVLSCAAQPKQEPPILFSNLFQQYQSIDSLHFRATCDQDWDSDKAQTGKGVHHAEGFYEFWKSGQSYRIVAQLDKGEPTNELVFDGEKLFYYDPAMERITITSNWNESSSSVILNPIFLPFAFLKPPSQDPVKNELFFRDFQSPAILSRLKHYKTASRNPRVVTLAGGVLDGDRFTYRIHVSEQPIQLPSVIDLVATNGNLLEQISISYQTLPSNGKETYWPSNIVEKLFGDAGDVAVKTETTLDPFTVGDQISSNVFKMDLSRAKSVYDARTGKITKQASGLTARLAPAVLLLFFAFSAAALVYVVFFMKKPALEDKN